ncbi:MAG: GNAT family N-acetyltransferase [Anaerolineae bacterium]|nr:GNAT family N-acetyltransferase [Anaerolineae bacterium]
MDGLPVIQTQRLRLMALSFAQLALCLSDLARLEQELSLPVSRAVITEIVQRAIRMKLDKMTQADPHAHAWYTYWLIVIVDKKHGAGLAGFKGVPDHAGEVEIGYGMAPEFQGHGYMTEAVRAMITWAFESPDCRVVIAPNTLRTNIGSNRVLEKAGFHIYQETSEAFYWRIDKNA